MKTLPSQGTTFPKASYGGFSLTLSTFSVQLGWDCVFQRVCDFGWPTEFSNSVSVSINWRTIVPTVYSWFWKLNENLSHTHTHTRTHMHTHTYINTADPLRTHGGWGCQPSPSQKSKCNSKSVLHIHTFNQVWIRKYSCTYLVEKIHISGPMQFKLLLFKGPLTNTCMHTHTHTYTHTHTHLNTQTQCLAPKCKINICRYY